MSDKLYNEANLNGTPYKVERWKEIATHDDKNIKGFFGEYRWMSNFEICDIFGYPATENAYMAAKVIPAERDYFKTCTPAESKKHWKTCTLLDKSVEEWDARKYEVMALFVFEKFRKHKDLREKLLATGDKYLEETNWWGDTYWGADINKGGQNQLGKLLIKIRAFWKE